MTQDKSDQSERFSDFSDRTDALALKLGVPVSDLCGKEGPLGLSQDMVMGYRTGRHRITDKAWRKLQRAEIDAGILPAGQKTLISQGVETLRVKEAAAILRRQAAELMAAADKLDPSAAAQARADLAEITRRALGEATQSHTAEQKRA